MELETSVLCISESYYVRIPASFADYLKLNGKSKARIKDITVTKVEVEFPNRG